MSRHWHELSRAVSVLALLTCAFFAVVASWLLSAPNSYGQSANPFSRYGGNWSGGGFIHLSNDSQEQIRCRGRFTSTETSIVNLRIQLRCASDTHNLDLESGLNYNSGAILGTWSDSISGVRGRVMGKFDGNNIRAIVESQAFRAALDLTSFGDRQRIRIQPYGTPVSAVIIGLSRNSR